MAFSMAESSGRHLWAVEDGVSGRGIPSAGVSECEILHVYVFMRDDNPRDSLYEIGARTSDAENLGGLPMKRYF